GRRDLGRAAQGPHPHAEADGRGLWRDPARHGGAGLGAAPQARQPAEVAARDDGAAQRTVRMTKVHVIGAGLAGLAASTALAQKGLDVALYEGAPQAGGRCRSYFDPVLGQIIDNGNHLVLSGNHAVMTYLKRIGAHDALAGP